MGCNNRNQFAGKNDCVADIVKDIVKAQDEVAQNGNGCCTTSCEQSIRDLLSPAAAPSPAGFSTVPFILYCGCEPFIASGVYQDFVPGSTTETFFNCIQSPVLRAKGFVKGSDSCVRVELLVGVDAAGDVNVEEGDSLCDFFPETLGDRARNFVATGICITLDLDCFCGIQCLTPVNPLPSSQFLG